MLAVLLVIPLVTLFVMYLMVAGPAQILRRRRSPLFSLFLNRNYDRRFWPGWAALLRNLWILLGIPVPLNQNRVPKRVAFAALGAFYLEGTAYAWLMKLGGKAENLVYRAERAEFWPSWQVTFLGIIVFLLVIPLSFWLCFALSRKLRRYARWRALLSVDEARLADPRSPVLFLRSFDDDQVSLAQTNTPWLVRFFDPSAVAGTLEELLLREFAYLGPVVAIGKPSDELPPLGAARKYCRGEKWQEVVGSLMDEALLIVVGVGHSEGLTWEIEVIRRKGLLPKTVFVGVLGASEQKMQFRSDQEGSSAKLEN
jgi:hypothetical protein